MPVTRKHPFVAVAVALLAASRLGAADPDGMVGAWNFADVVSGTVRDYSEFYNCGKIIGISEAVVKDSSGKPVLRTGEKGAFFSVPDNPAYSGRETTVELRFRGRPLPPETGSRRVGGVFNFNSNRLRVWLNPNGTLSADAESVRGIYFSTPPLPVPEGETHLFAWLTPKELGLAVNGKLVRIPVTEEIKKQGTGFVVGAHPYRPDRVCNAEFESVVLYDRKLPDEMMTSGRTGAFRPAPEARFGVYNPGEKVRFVTMDGAGAEEPSVSGGEYSWSTPAGKIVRRIRFEEDAGRRKELAELRRSGVYPDYLLDELERLLSLRSDREFEALAKEARSLKRFFEDAARYDAFARRELDEEVMKGKPGLVPPLHLDVSSDAPDSLTELEVEEGCKAYARCFWLQTREYEFDRKLAERLREKGLKVGLFMIPHIPAAVSRDWTAKHPEQEDVSYWFVLRKAEGGTLEIPLRRPNPRFDHRKYWQVRDDTAGRDVPPEDWNYRAENSSVTVRNAVEGHEYVVYYMVDSWGSLSHRIRAVFPNPEQESRYHEAFIRFCESVRGTVSLIHGDGVYPYPGHEFSNWWDNQGYGRCTASPMVQQAFEASAGIRFEPRFLYPNFKGPTLDKVPGDEYLAWMKFNRENFVRYMKGVAGAAERNGIRYQIYWGDQHIGFVPGEEGLSATGIHNIVRSLQGSVDLRCITGLPGNAVKGGRLEWLFPNQVNNPALIETQLRRWQENKRGNLFKVQDCLYWAEYASLFHYDRGFRLRLFCDVIRRVNAEYLLMYKYLHGQEVFRHPKFVCYVIGNWGKTYPWFPWGDETYLRHFTDIPVEMKFLGIRELEAAGVPADADVLVNFGDLPSAWNGDCDWSKPSIQKPIREFIARGGGFAGFGGEALRHIGGALGFSRENVWWRGGWQPIHWETLPDTRDEGRFFRYGEGRVVLFKGASADRKISNFAKIGLFRAAGREKELTRLFCDNSLVLPYAYPSTGVLVLHNDSPEPQKTRLRLDGSIFPGTGESLTLRNIADGRDAGVYTQEQLRAGVEFTLPASGTEYFRVK